MNDKKLKITFVIPPPNMSGGSRVIAIYAQALIQRGHDVTVVAQNYNYPSIWRRLKTLIRRGRWLGVPNIQDNHFQNYSIDVQMIDKHRPIVASDLPDADVVVATWWETAEWVAGMPATKGVGCYFIQGYEIFPGQPTSRVEQTYKSSLHKITLSKWIRETMRDVYGDPQVAMIYNSVDTETFFADERSKQKVPTVGMLYAPGTLKGCDISFKALEKVRQQIPNVRTVLFGHHVLKASLRPPNSVFYRSPEQDKIRDVYGQCDVWLCGSRSEGFHLPILEAMACRCPVVSTKVGGPLDIVCDGENGYLVDIEDAQGLADRLNQILQLPESDWKKMSDRALATATGYTWEDAADQFERALQLAEAGQFGEAVNVLEGHASK